MTRIQILELPSEEVGGVRATPFALIIDQCSERFLDHMSDEGLTHFRDRCGARAVLVAEGVIDVHAGGSTTLGAAHVKVVPDLTDFGSQVAAAVADAQTKLTEALTPKPVEVRIGE